MAERAHASSCGAVKRSRSPPGKAQDPPSTSTLLSDPVVPVEGPPLQPAFRAVIEYFSPKRLTMMVAVVTGDKVPSTVGERTAFRTWLIKEALQADLADSALGYYLSKGGRFSPIFEARVCMDLTEILQGHDMYLLWVQREMIEAAAEEVPKIIYTVESVEPQVQRRRYRVPLQM